MVGRHAPANEGKAPIDAAGGQQNLHGQASRPNGGAARGGGGGGTGSTSSYNAPHVTKHMGSFVDAINVYSGKPKNGQS